MLMPVFGGKLNGHWLEAPETPDEYIEHGGDRYLICWTQQGITIPTADDPDEVTVDCGPLLWWLGTDEANAEIRFDQIAEAHANRQENG